ncbi:MAG: transcriptional regulator [Bacillota bacterium]|nr:transcriptional regulator [Bacillota bacterium]
MNYDALKLKTSFSVTLTPLLKKMEAQGLLLRTRSSVDERSVIVSLTQKGYQLRDQTVDIPGKIGSCIRSETQFSVR